MSEDEIDKPPPAGDEGRGETTKPVAPPPEIKLKAKTKPETQRKKDRPRRKRGIMRSFFSHIIVAALAVAGVGGYFHWEDLLSQTGGRVCAYEILGKYGSSEPGTKTAVASTDESRTVEKAPEKAPEASKIEAPVVKAPEAPKAVAPVAKAPEVEQPKPVTSTPASDEPKSDAKTTEMKAEEKPAVTKEAEKTVPTDSAEKAAITEAVAKTDASETGEQPKETAVSKPDDADAPKVSIISSSDKNAFEAERDNARRTYWVDKKAAEKAYLELIAQYPDKAGIKGELGNIYVMTGSNEKAASQFLDAGMIWVNSGEKDKATKLVDLLEKLSPEKAASLKDALANAG